MPKERKHERLSREPGHGKLTAIQQLQALTEEALTDGYVIPLLDAMGATHIRKTHGAQERGKDLIFVKSTDFTQNALFACQIKNHRMSDRATDPYSATAVLTQLVNCRKRKALNPVNHRKELPHGVIFVNAFPFEDCHLADGENFLDQLRELGCETISPETLLELIKTHLPNAYRELIAPGSGLAAAMMATLDIHHEAVAFDLGKHARPLSEFYVNLGMQESAHRIGFMLHDDAELRFPVGQTLNAADAQLIRATQDSLPSTEPGLEFAFGQTGKPFSGDDVNLVAIDFEPLGSRLRQRLEELQRTADSSTVAPYLRLALAADAVIRVVDEVLPGMLDDSAALPGPALADVRPDTLIDINFNVCVVGEAGAGKTSLARAIARNMLKNGRQCVYFPCSRIRSSSHSLLPALKDYLGSLARDVTRTTIDEYTSGATAFVIDGCDEAATFGPKLGKEILALGLLNRRVKCRATKGRPRIPGHLVDAIRFDPRSKTLELTSPVSDADLRMLEAANQRTPFKRAVTELTLLARKVTRIFVTTRQAEDLHLHGFGHFGLLPFDANQLTSFFSSWFANQPQRLAAIEEFLGNNEYIREVCRTPIVATLLAALCENGHELPKSKTGVYEERFDLLLDRWDRARDVAGRNRIAKKDKLWLLMRIALTLHERHATTFETQELSAIWGERLGHKYPELDAEDALSELLVRNTVIVQVEPNKYSFGHLSYQEFLTARAYIFSGKGRELIPRFLEAWWSHVIVFYAGLCGDVDDFVTRIHGRFGLTGTKTRTYTEMMQEANFTSRIVRDAVMDLVGETEDDDEGAGGVES